MSFYSDLAADTLSLLTEFGQDVTLNQNETGTYVETSTGVVTLAAVNSVTVKGVLLDFIYRTFGEESTHGMIQNADKRLIMSAGTVPTVKDTITVDGHEYRIVNIKQVNPAGTPVMYDIWMKL